MATVDNYKYDRQKVTTNLSYEANSAQLVRPDAVVVAERAALLAHNHRLKIARTRRVVVGRNTASDSSAGDRLLGEHHLRLHGRGRMVDHDVVADKRIVRQLVVDADVAVDDALRETLAPRHRLRARIRTLYEQVGGLLLLLKGRVLHFDAGGSAANVHRDDVRRSGRVHGTRHLVLGGRGAGGSRDAVVVGHIAALDEDVLSYLAHRFLTLNDLRERSSKGTNLLMIYKLI